MKKHSIPEAIRFDRERRKQPGHFQWFADPSRLATEIWNHILSIGTSRCSPGFDGHSGNQPDGYTLHYIRQGELKHILPNQTFSLPKGAICFLDTTRSCHLLNAQSGTALLWWVFFNGSTLHRVFTALRADEEPVFEGIDGERFETMFHQLWNLVARKPIGFEARVHAALSDILAELFASRLKTMRHIELSDASPSYSEKVRLALDFVARTYDKNISLDHFEEAVHLSIQHFSRKFRKEVGMAPIQYLYHFRIEQAKRLLAGTDRTVGEIARLVGIPEQSYFARLFHKKTGQTPRRYREKEQTLRTGPLQISSTRRRKRRRRK